MVDVKRVKLPGVGVLHTFVTDGGGKVGVITHRSGHSDLITFSDAEDGAKAIKVALRLGVAATWSTGEWSPTELARLARLVRCPRAISVHSRH